MYKSQIWRIAELFDDLNPRTSKMVAKELQLSNKSVSVHLFTLAKKWGCIQVLGKALCPITGATAQYYQAILWIKKKG